MIYGVATLIIGCISLFQLIKYPVREEDDIISNNIRGWAIAICGIFFGLAIIIKELLK
jgi:hypothetical protein